MRSRPRERRAGGRRESHSADCPRAAREAGARRSHGRPSSNGRESVRARRRLPPPGSGSGSGRRRASCRRGRPPPGKGRGSDRAPTRGWFRTHRATEPSGAPRAVPWPTERAIAPKSPLLQRERCDGTSSPPSHLFGRWAKLEKRNRQDARRFGGLALFAEVDDGLNALGALREHGFLVVGKRDLEDLLDAPAPEDAGHAHEEVLVT